MFPVSASGLGRCTREPTVIGGYLIPAGCEVQVDVAHTHICIPLHVQLRLRCSFQALRRVVTHFQDAKVQFCRRL